MAMTCSCRRAPGPARALPMPITPPPVRRLHRTLPRRFSPTADMIVKVKEPQAGERAMLREGQVLFTYLHLAPDPAQTKDLLASGATCIAYETVTDARGGLPLLAPMSEVAGRLAPQVGAWTLQKANGGRGVLMGGVPGVGPARVLVLGGGVVGTHAARIAAGMGADVTVLDRSLPRLRYLDDVFGGSFRTGYSSTGLTARAPRRRPTW